MSFLNELAEIESDPRYAQLAPDIRTTVLDNWEKAASAGKSGVEAEAAASAARTLLESRQSRLKARLPANPLGTLADVPPPLSALTSDPRWGTLDPTVRKQTIDNWAGAKAKTAIDAKLRPSEAMSMYREVVAGQVMAEGPEKPDEAFNARLNSDVQDISAITKDPTVRAGGFRAGKLNDKFVVNPSLALAGEDEYAKAVDEADATPVEKLRAKALYGVGKDAALKSIADITTRAVSDSRIDWGSLNPLAPKGIDSIPTVVIGGKTIDFDDAAEIAITPSRAAMYGKNGGSQEALFSTDEGVRKEAEIRTAQQLARYVLPAIGADAAAARILENPEGPEAKELVEAHRDTLKQELWVKAGDIDNNVFEKGRMLSNGVPVFNPNWARSNPDPKDIEDVIQKVGITASVDDVKEGIKNEARASASRLVLRAGLEEQTERPVSWMPSLASLSPVNDALADLGTNALPNKFRNYVAEKQKAGVTDPLTIVDGYEKEYGMLTDDVSIGLRKAVSQTKSIAAGLSGILGTVAEQFGGANATSKFLTGLSADIIKETSEAEQLQSELTGSNAGFGSTVTQSIATEAPFMAVGLLAGRAASAARYAAVNSTTAASVSTQLARKMATAASMDATLASSADALVDAGSGILKTYFGLQASRSFGGVYASTYTAQKERALRMGRTEEEADRDARVSSILPSIAGGVATAVLMKMFPGGSEEAIRSMATKESVESVMARAGTAMGAKGGENIIANAFRNVQALRATKDFARTYFSQNILKRVGLKTFAGMADEALEETIDEAFQGMLGSVYDERTTLQDVVTNALQAGGIGAIIGGGASGIAAYKESLKVIRDAKKNKPVSPDVAPVVADLEANGDTATAEALRTAASAPDNFQVAIDKLNGFDEVAGKGRFNFVFESAPEEGEDEGIPTARFVVPVEDPDPAKAAAAMAATVASVEEAIAADPDLKDMLVVSGDAANGIVTLTPSIGAVTSWAAGAAGSAPVLDYAQQHTKWLADKTAEAETAGDAEYDALSAKYKAQFQAASDAASALVNNPPAYNLVKSKGDKSANWQKELGKLPPDIQVQVTSARAAADSANELNAARIKLLERMFKGTKPVNPDKKASKAKAKPTGAKKATSDKQMDDDEKRQRVIDRETQDAANDAWRRDNGDIEETPATDEVPDVVVGDLKTASTAAEPKFIGALKTANREAVLSKVGPLLEDAVAIITEVAEKLNARVKGMAGQSKTNRDNAFAASQAIVSKLQQAMQDGEWGEFRVQLGKAKELLKSSGAKLTSGFRKGDNPYDVFEAPLPTPRQAPAAPKPKAEPKVKEKPPIPDLEQMDDIVLPEGATDEQKFLFEQLKKAIAAFPESARERANAWIVSLRDGLAKTGLMQLEGTRSVIRRALSDSRDEAFKDRVAAAIGLDTYTNLAAKWKKPTKSKKQVPKPIAEAAESADTRGEEEDEAPAAPKTVRLKPGKQPSRAPSRWKEKVGDALMEELRAAVNATSIPRVEWGHVAVVAEDLRNRVNNALYESQVVDDDTEEGLRLQNHLNVVSALNVAEDPEGTVDSLKVPKADRGSIESIDTPGKIAERLVYAARGKGVSIVESQAGSSLAGQDMSALQPGIAAELSWKAYLWALGRRIEANPGGDHTADLARAERLFAALMANGLWKKLAGKKEDFLLAVRTPNASLDPDYEHTNTVRYLLRQPITGLRSALVKAGAKRLQSGSTAQQKEREKNTLRDEETTAALVTQAADQESPLKDKIDAAISEYLESVRQFFEDQGAPAPSEDVLGKAAAAQAAKDVEKRELTTAETLALRKVAVAKDRATGKLKTREADTRTEELDAIREAFDAAVAALGGDVTTDLGAVLKRIAADKGNSYSGIAEILSKANAASFVQGVTIIDDPDKEPAFYDPDSKTITFNRAVASVRGFTDDIVHEVLHAATDSFLSQKHPAGSPEAKIVEELLAIQTTLLARFKAAAPSWKAALGVAEGTPDFFSDLVALRAATLLESDKRAWLRENAGTVYEETMTGDAVSELFYDESLKDAATRRQGLIDVLRDFEYALGETSEFKAYNNGIFKEFLTLMYTSPVFQEAAQNARELNTPGEQAGPKFFTKFVKAIRGMLGTLVKSRTTAPVKVPDYSILRDLLAAQEESRSVASRRPGPTVSPVIAPPVIAPPVITPPRAPSITKPRRPTFGSAKPAPAAATTTPTESEAYAEAMQKKAAREASGGTTGEWKQPGTDEPPIPAGTVRFYHAGSDPKSGGSRWVSPSRQWVSGFRPGAEVYFVDVPVNDPQLTKAYDDSGIPMSARFMNFEADEEKVKGFTLLAPTAEEQAAASPVKNVASLTVPPSYNTPAFASAFENAIDQATTATGFGRGLSQVTVEVEATELTQQAESEDEAVAALAPITKIEEAGNLASLPDAASVEEIFDAAPKTSSAAVSLASVYKDFGAWSSAVQRRLGAAVGRFARTIWNGLKVVAALAIAGSMYMGPLSPETSAGNLPSAVQLADELTQDELVAASVATSAVTQPNATPSTETRSTPELTEVERNASFKAGATAALNKFDAQKVHYVQFGDEFNQMALEATPLTPAMKELASLMGQKEGTRATGPNRLLAPIFRHGGVRGSQDEIPWCAMSVSYALTKAGTPTRNAFASEFLSEGTRVTTPQIGDVVVFNKRNEKDNSILPNTAGHVGFFMADLGNYILVLDGNVGDKVAITAMSKRRFMQYRRIKTPGTRAPFTITLSQGAANRLAAGFATADDTQEVLTGIEGIIEDEHAAFWGREPEVLGTRRRDSAVRRLPQYLRDALPEDEAQDIDDMYNVFTGASRNSPFTLDDAIYAGRATRMALTWLLNEDLRRLISNGNPSEGAKAADLSHALSVLTESGGDVAGKSVADIYAMRTAPGLRETALKALSPLGISIKSRVASTPGFFTPRALRIDDKFHATTRALSDARNIFSTVSSTASPDTLVWKLMTVKDPAKLLALVPEYSRPGLEAARSVLRSNYAEITTKSLGTLTGMQDLWDLASRLEVLKEAAVNPMSTADSRGMMIPRLAAILKEAGLDTDEILPVRQQMATYKDDAARFSNVVSEAARAAVNRFAMGKKVPAGARLEFMAAGSEALAFRDKAQGLVYKVKLPQRMGADTGFSFDVASPTPAPEEGEVLFSLTDGLGRSSLWNELNEMHTAVPGIVDHEVVGFTDFGALITVQRDVRGQAYSPAEDEGVIEEWMDANGARRIPAGRLYSEDFARDATSNAFTVTDAAGFTRILADVRPANASVVNGAFLLFDPAISPAVEGEAKEILGTRRRETQSLIPSLTTFFGLTTVPGEVASRTRLIEAALGITRLSRWASEKGKWGDLYKVQKELENNVQRAVTLTETLFSTITSRMDKAGLNSKTMTAEQKRQAADIDTILGTIDTLRDEQAAQAAEKERSRARRRVAMGIAQRRKLADQMTPANRMRESASIATDANLQYAQIETAYFDAIIAAEQAATAAFKQKQADAAARLKADGLTNVLEAAQNLRNHLNDLSLKIQATTGADARVRAHYNARMGIHLSRYYEIHDNPAYAAWLWGSDPEAVKLRTAGITWIRNARATRFAADLKSRMRGATTQEIERVAKEMASKLDDSGLMQELNDIIQKHMNRGGVGGVGSPGMLNGTILMERMNVPKELRELLGEYKDHVATAARTALEMGIYYANYVYLDGIRVELQSRQDARTERLKDLTNKGPLRNAEEEEERERLLNTFFITDSFEVAQKYGLKPFKPTTSMINTAAFGSLQGFYGPEITVEAMNDLEGGGGTNAVLSGYAELLGITMKSFTVWNVRGQARNFLSSIAFIPASGHLSIPVWRESALEGNDKASASFKHWGALGNARLKDRMAAIGVEKAVAEFTDMYVKRGIIGGSDAAVFREEMRKVAGKDYGAAVGRVLDKYNSSASTVTTKASEAAEVFKAIDRFMTEVHRGSDDYFKKILFELEYDARLKEFGVEVKDGVPVMTDKAARRIVEVYGNKGLLTPANEAEVGGDVKARAQLLMEIVSAEATFSKIPYYNRLPEVVNAFKRQKLGLVTAPFISWPAAIWSQPFKAFKQYQQDRAVPETAERAWKTAVAYGATVAGWNLFVGTTLSAIVWALSHLGLGDEDKKIRPVFGLFTPESRALQDFLNKDFYKYRSIALLGMRGENPVWADVSWMTPWSTITDTVTPFFHPRARESSTDFIEAAKASLDKVLKTVLSPQIPISNAFDALTADDFRTKNASFGEKLIKVAGAVAAPLVPMTVKDVAKVVNARNTERFATEAVSTVLGLKINETDIRESLARTARAVAAQDAETMDRYRRLLTNGRADDIGNLETLYDEGMNDMRRLYLDLYQKMGSGSVFLGSDTEVRKIVREDGRGLGFERLQDLYNGVIRGWKPGPTTLERAARMAAKEGGDDRVRKATELPVKYGVQSLSQ